MYISNHMDDVESMFNMPKLLTELPIRLLHAGVKRYLQTWYTSEQAQPDDGQLHAHHHPVVISWPGFGILFFWQLGALLMPDSSLPCNNCVGDVQYIQGGP
jgi:hypothetical protein